jgi:serine phosphatase RsbU (regulator of sigma subunit)
MMGGVASNLPSDPARRVAELEHALAMQKAAQRVLQQVLDVRTRELAEATDRLKRQTRLVGTRSAVALLGEHGTLERAAPHLLGTIGSELGWHRVHLWMIDRAAQGLRCHTQWSAPDLEAAELESVTSRSVFARESGIPGQVWTSGKALWIADVATEPNFLRRAAAVEAGLFTACAFPILVDGNVFAVVEMFATDPRPADEDLMITLTALGAQIGQVIERTRTHEELRFKELQIARRIQTAILPRELEVPALEVAATMVPATEVGGDYYDVLPFSGGAWIGIGDVTGHGVGAGMVMIMVQSAVAALATQAKTPRDAVIALNGLLYDTIRRRLRTDDHMTFTLLRYTSNGRVLFAGAHEDIIVWRAATKRCERFETPGTWLGAMPSITSATVDSEILLARGDLLVLYTDGLIESRDARREPFGVERLCAEIETLAASKPEPSTSQLIDLLLSRSLMWGVSQDDDVSLVVMRYRGNAVFLPRSTTMTMNPLKR